MKALRVLLTGLSVLLPQVQAGKVKPIAIGSKERVSSLPNVPTTGEVGLPQIEAENWYGMVAPAGTPPAIIAHLHKITTEAMADATVKEKLAAQGATLVGDTPEHFRGFIDSEIKKWAKVIKDAGVVTTK